MTRITHVLVPLIALAACATPETRLRNGLQDAGLSPPMASCMADDMVNELSITQLRRIQSLGSLKDDRLSDLSVTEFLHKVRALRDPEILAVTSMAAGTCALGI
ncbi:hypothetical protein [Sphingomonas sp. LaA6.9]|uniref:hypothetical protein n=1 Tax=Sphingomonas sp. LaA6.9 TaxID=2919914 RepID=UPI001F4F9EFC|nr:hypothetical protein [Sphingomonas sp. LaA6.9]MCJ8156230.1 hypothetical protein [Sphingomonas sp. LaA6.9]